jgi:hypothetical protein
MASTGQRPHKGLYVTKAALQTMYMAVLLFTLAAAFFLYGDESSITRLPLDAAETLTRCEELNTLPGPLPAFFKREKSDRFSLGTKPVWIRNATIWTGRVEGLEIIHGDLLLADGVIKALGDEQLVMNALADYDTFDEVNAHGAWVSPGCVF